MAGLNPFKWLSKTTAKIFTHPRFQLWALWAAGPVFLLADAILLAIIVVGSWPVELRGEQLKYVGISAWIVLGLLGASLFFMADAIKKIHVKFGATEIELETNDDPIIPAGNDDDSGQRPET